MVFTHCIIAALDETINMRHPGIYKSKYKYVQGGFKLCNTFVSLKEIKSLKVFRQRL